MHPYTHFNSNFGWIQYPSLSCDLLCDTVQYCANKLIEYQITTYCDSAGWEKTQSIYEATEKIHGESLLMELDVAPICCINIFADRRSATGFRPFPENTLQQAETRRDRVASL